MTSSTSDHKPLPLFTKIIYGSGDLGLASWGTLRQIFYAIFLTDVVGLEARFASVAALIDVIWDAINDPSVNWSLRSCPLIEFDYHRLVLSVNS